MIEQTAIIHPQAKLGKNVSVGHYSIIGKDAVVGDDTQIGEHCLVTGFTQIGKKCRIFTGAVIGSIPQDLKYKGEKTALIIGNGNIIREYVTINPGTAASEKTQIGNDNLLMAYAHVAHDCLIGNNCILANNATLAGHVLIEDKAIIGGLCAVHQFVRIGYLAITGGCSKIVQDVPPFCTADGHPAKVHGLNSEGLKRTGVNPETVSKLKKAYRLIFHSGLNTSHALEKVEREVSLCPEVARLIKFIKDSQRGICR
jgi:UDP-N-acetylglucosamine acyltransferase